MFKVQNAINILKSFVIFNNNRFTRFLTLFKKKIDNNVINKSSIKNKINFCRYKEFELNNQRISFKDALYFKKINITIV